MYKSDYPTYLVHFNKNHDPKNGQFAEGDGDGDGIIDDHHYKKPFNEMSRKEKKEYIKYRQKRGDEIKNRSTAINNERKLNDKEKKIREKYLKSLDKYWDSFEKNNWDTPEGEKVIKQFTKDEKEYLIDEGRYIAKKLIDEYGEKEVAELSFGFVLPFKSSQGRSSVEIKYNGKVDDLIDKYAETYWYVHREE